MQKEALNCTATNFYWPCTTTNCIISMW